LVHELKLDGYRVQAHIQNGRVRLYTRGGFDWTSRFATIVASLTRLPAANLVLDGEIICADQRRPPKLQRTARRFATRPARSIGVLRVRPPAP
jgi:ATP-dependent DNA ligase